MIFWFLFYSSTLVSIWSRLRVVPHFSSGIVERTKRERAWKSPHARKGDIAFLEWGDFHARSRFARSTIPEEKWGTTRSLHLIKQDAYTRNAGRILSNEGVKLHANGHHWQHATTYNRMCKRTKHVTWNNVASVCTGLYPVNTGTDGKKRHMA